MVIDMAAPVASFFVLHVLLGAGTILALCVGAVVAGLRTLYRAARLRRLSAFPLMMLVILAATLVLVFITGDPRLVLAKSAVIPAVGGSYGIITNFFGRTLLHDVAGPFVTKGDPRLTAAWQDCWEHDATFVRRLRLLNLIWGIGFVVSAVLRVVIIYRVPLDVAVLAGQVPTIVALLTLILLTRVLGGPLVAALRARADAAGEPEVPAGTVAAPRGAEVVDGINGPALALERG
jgi:hypothetical protein